MSYESVLSVDGNPINGTYRVTLADALATLSSLNIPITVGTMKAVAVLVSVETNDARLSFGGTGSGHVIASGVSGIFRGPAAIAAMKLGNKTASSNAVVEVTVFF